MENTNCTQAPTSTARRLKETIDEESLQDDFENGNNVSVYMPPSSRRHDNKKTMKDKAS